VVTEKSKPKSGQKYPLIGIFDADGGLTSHPGVGGQLGNPVSCPTDGTLRPADQHIHTVDP